MLRAVVLVTMLSACDPGVCGHVAIAGVATNPEIEQYRQPDGTIGLVELCGTDYGAFALSRENIQMTTLTFDPDVEGGDDDAAVTGIVLPAASVVFWNAHLVKGNTITIRELAGSGLHKSSEGDTYTLYALSAGTITVLDGPNNRDTTTFDGEMHFTEEWKLRWSLDYGVAQHWEGEDTVKRSDGTTAGTPPFYPPDPKP